MRQAALAQRPQALEADLGLQVSRPEEAHEREADRVADQVLASPLPVVTPLVPRGSGVQRKASGPLTGAGRPAGLLPGAGSPLPAAARGFLEPRFGRNLGDVRVHTGAPAQSAAHSLGARAFTRGADIYFGRGEFAPGTQTGMRLLAHEVTHTLQPSGADRIFRKTLTDIPETTRKALTVTRNTADQGAVDGWITNYFDPTSGVSGNPAADVEFGVEISDAVQQKGFKGVAHELENLTTVLPVGTIYDLALDLRPQGFEHGIFRFTHYTDGKTNKILIERTTTLAPAPATKPAKPATGGKTAPGPAAAQPQGQAQQPAAAAPAATFTGTVTVGAIKVEIGAGFSNDRGKQIVDAIGMMPATIQAKADGVTFRYEGSGVGPNGRAGDYDPMADSVQVWGDMFNASPRRIGKGTDAESGILHELGHALDLRPLFKAQNARDAARKTKKDAEDALKHPKIDMNDPDPLGGAGDHKSDKQLAEEKRLKDVIAAADKEITTQNAAMKTAKSIAGDELGDSADSEQLLTDFGKALAADGVKAVKDARKTNRKTAADNKKAEKFNEANPNAPQKALGSDINTLSGNVTDYADTNLMEAYAENFQIYILDEALLKAIRPNTFAFFAKSLPKSAPAPTGGTKP